jgi:uncharacterized paraquat-inducible protein A
MVTYDDDDHVTCPHCGEITHIGGLIGEHTDDCPRCGKRALYPKTSWPFPTSLVNKPLNDVPVKIDGLKDAQEAPL